jgi:ribonucleoside-diphosphate reductase alpha chain
MENNPIVSADQEIGTSHYNEVLAKRIRPKVRIEDLEMKDKKAENTETKIEEVMKAQHKFYTQEEAMKASTEYFKGDSLAANVWVGKYALKNPDGQLHEKTPDDMHRRIAREIARIEMKYPNPMSEEEIFDLVRNFRYIVPQGSPMAGIGNDYQIGSLSNCFVIGNEGDSDSYGGIMKVDEEQVQLMKRRGGVGHDLSHIRPKHSIVKNSALTATGIVPFMERYSNSTREVAQEGRRGALMLSISVLHPDAEHFIDAKLEAGKVTGANISVKITDSFMKAVIEDGEFIQQYPIDSKKPAVVRPIRARELWQKIVHNAWKSAEPGILFWDTIIRESLPDCYADLGFKTVSTNPCGEIPLCTYDSCRLMAINLYNYVDKPLIQNFS